MDKVPMTVQGHKALAAEFEHRTSNERRRIIDAIAEARAHGDLSENAEYSAAKEQQSLNEGRIKELETLLALADVIDVSKLSGDKVKFGATVTMADGTKLDGTLLRQDDFIVTLLLPDGTRKVMVRTNGVPKVEVKDPKRGHVDAIVKLAHEDTDAKLTHDITAYLWTIK